MVRQTDIFFILVANLLFNCSTSSKSLNIYNPINFLWYDKLIFFFILVDNSLLNCSTSSESLICYHPHQLLLNHNQLNFLKILVG